MRFVLRLPVGRRESDQKKKSRNVKFADDATGRQRTQSLPAADADWGRRARTEEGSFGRPDGGGALLRDDRHPPNCRLVSSGFHLAVRHRWVNTVELESIIVNLYLSCGTEDNRRGAVKDFESESGVAHPQCLGS